MVCFIAGPLFCRRFLKNDKFRTGIEDYTTESLTCIDNGRAENNEACSTGVADRLHSGPNSQIYQGNHLDDLFKPGYGLGNVVAKVAYLLKSRQHIYQYESWVNSAYTALEPHNIIPPHFLSHAVDLIL